VTAGKSGNGEMDLGKEIDRSRRRKQGDLMEYVYYCILGIVYATLSPTGALCWSLCRKSEIRGV